MIPLNTIQCRDCLEGMREIPDKSIDLVITDPPYGIPRHEHGSLLRDKKNEYPQGILWDHRPKQEYFDEIIRISKNQIICGGNHFALPISRGWIFWYKHQPIENFSEGELIYTSFDKVVKCFDYPYTNVMQGTGGRTEIKVHPTQKPVKLFEWIIKNYAKEGDTICDPFFGSGSSLVAAVRMGHQFIGFEKEPSYFEKAQVRIKKAQEQGKIGSWFE